MQRRRSIALPAFASPAFAVVSLAAATIVLKLPTLETPAYWDEMHAWLETGQGRESDPSRFVPQHLLHAAAFVALSLLTASTVSVVFGAALMNYMAYYVAEVVRLTPSHPVEAALLGWHPWSVVRIVSFVILGVVLAEPLLRRLTGAPRQKSSRVFLGLALAGLLIDVCLKAALAPHWAAVLRGLR